MDMGRHILDVEHLGRMVVPKDSGTDGKYVLPGWSMKGRDLSAQAVHWVPTLLHVTPIASRRGNRGPQGGHLCRFVFVDAAHMGIW